MAFGVDFETNIDNSGSLCINCHHLYLGEATQKRDNRGCGLISTF